MTWQEYGEGWLISIKKGLDGQGVSMKSIARNECSQSRVSQTLEGAICSSFARFYHHDNVVTDTARLNIPESFRAKRLS